VIFDEKTSCIKLLNSFSSLLHVDLFDIIEEIGLVAPSFGVSTRNLTFIPELTSSLSTPNQTVETHDLLFEVDHNSPVTCLP